MTAEVAQKVECSPCMHLPQYWVRFPVSHKSGVNFFKKNEKECLWKVVSVRRKNMYSNLGSIAGSVPVYSSCRCLPQQPSTPNPPPPHSLCSIPSCRHWKDTWKMRPVPPCLALQVGHPEVLTRHSLREAVLGFQPALASWRLQTSPWGSVSGLMVYSS